RPQGLAPRPVWRESAHAKARSARARRRQRKSCNRRQELDARFDQWLATDEARQLTQSARQSIAREFTVCAWQLEYQFAAFDFHRGLGKHAALSSRENISDAHRGPQHARTIKHSCCRKLSQPRGQVLFTQSGVTKIHRQRQVRASGMINRNERTVRERVLCVLA